MQRRRLAFGIRPLAPAPPLGHLALLEIGTPADIVQVEHTAVGIEVEHLVDHGLEQRRVVTDHDKAAAVRAQVVAQPGNGVRVQMVRRLVEKQRLRATEQDPGKFHAAPLATGQAPKRLPKDPVGQAKARRHRGRLRFGRVTAEHMQPVLEPRVGTDRGIPAAVRRCHLILRPAHPGEHLVQAACGQNPVHGEHVEIARARILGKVANGTRAAHIARGGKGLSREHAGERRFARAVPADQPDPVPWADLERRIINQQPRSGTQLKARCNKHWDCHSFG